MTSDTLNALFALLETEDEDFASLVRRFGIDPATDLQNCDLTDVDFGSLTADTLDLTGSSLEGADLSKVNCKRVIGLDTAVPAPKRAAFDNVLMAISRYQNADWVLNQIVSTVAGSSAPVLAFYDTAADQDLLTKRICAHYGDASHLREGFNAHASGMKLLWFYSKATKGNFKLNPAFLDKAFFEALRSSNKSDDIGIYPFRPNQAAVERIRTSVHPGDYDQMRRAFVQSLRKEILTRAMGEMVTFPGSVVVFSGFTPLSKRLYREMREAVNGKLTLICLCSSGLEPYYLQDKGMPWRRVAVPAYSIGEPLTVAEDVRRICKRIEMSSGGRMTVSDGIRLWMQQFVGKPLVVLKHNVVAELSTAFPLSARRATRPKAAD